MRLLAKCSSLISISPRFQPSPTSFKVGNTTWRSDLLEAERSKALVEHRVSGGLVVAADRREQASGEVLEHSLGRPLVLECGTGGLRG